MKIIKLKAENIKKLVAVEITPAGNVVRITGKNGAGKTSVLDSIFWALGGQQNIAEEPIRKGEKRAAIEVDLGDMIVHRTFTEGGGTALTIENKDGLRFKSPQTMLDGLIGRLTFDPLDFMRQEPRKQFETLRMLTGVDFSKLDGMRQRAYDERTQVNRDVKRLEVQAEGVVIPKEPDPPGDSIEVDVAELAGKVTEAVELRNSKEKIDGLSRAAQISLKQEGLKILSIQEEINALTKRLKAATDESLRLEQDIIALDEQSTAITVPDIAALGTELKTAEDRNREIRQARAAYAQEKARIETAKTRKREYQEELKVAEEKAKGLTAKIDEIDGEKARQIAEAKFPLVGLGFGNGAVTFNDLPLSQASSAEQLRVSMAMAMALNPKLRVIRVTDGSLLDSDSLTIIEEMANSGDFQVWMESVDETGKVGVYIVDGQVAAVN